MQIEKDLSWIESVKEQTNDGIVSGYLVNGSLSIPIADSNRHYNDIKIWLESNTPEPEFTDEEIAKQELDKQIAEAQAYLDSTDFKMTADYDQDTTEVKVKRQEAREFIRANESSTAN